MGGMVFKLANDLAGQDVIEQTVDCVDGSMVCTLKFRKDGTYVVVAGSIEGPDEAGYYSFIQDHYSYTNITGDEGDQLTVKVNFDPSGDEYYATGIFEDVSKIPVKSSTCFVATACFQNEKHATVSVLRRFRDEILTTTQSGSRFIVWYNRAGPRLARGVTLFPWVRRPLKCVLALLAYLISRAFPSIQRP